MADSQAVANRARVCPLSSAVSSMADRHTTIAANGPVDKRQVEFSNELLPAV
jgi:hypothetical protein